jgi:hypothetical protein
MISDPKHPIWPIIRYTVVAVTMIVLCSVLYKNGFDPKDMVLILSTLASLAGIDSLKTRMMHDENE